jgi:hypothetical protein
MFASCHDVMWLKPPVRSNDQPRMAELGRLAMDGVMSPRTARPTEKICYDFGKTVFGSPVFTV